MKLWVNRKNYKKIAMTFSILGLILWGLLGTGASLAWFSDTSPEINNIFHFADFDLEVSHRLDDGTWEVIDSTTKVFKEDDLYEPGYVQVVYLRVENKGSVPFQFKTSVNVNGCIIATNVFGQSFSLQDYLKFGVVTSKSETDMLECVSTRQKAVEIADMKLSHYTTQQSVLEPQQFAYVTMVVRMPEEVGNVANYRGDVVPMVELGVIVKADQIQE